MKLALLIARAEFNYWLRSKLVVTTTLLFSLLIVVSSAINAIKLSSERHERQHQQQESERTFRDQPDRHPHRMVHYGHYVHRSLPPLSIFDPGLDSVTGQTVFLEGHRQNSATFSEAGASADFGSMSMMTPAFVYQVIAPLLILIMGYSAITREREAGVLRQILAQGTSGYVLLLGKWLALVSVCLCLLIPLCLIGSVSVFLGESAATVAMLLASYLFYLCVWVCLSLFVSCLMRERSGAIAVLAAVWICLTLVFPSLASLTTKKQFPIAGKIESDFSMFADLRKQGDGHNVNDPAFKKMIADLLAEHAVDNVKDLPVNIRGVVALKGEEKQTAVLNHYADLRMENELRQSEFMYRFEWLTPSLAIARISRSLSATDLQHYHKFLKDAEALRFEFVQGLNRAQAEKLSYQNDINRNKDTASWERARVDASAWQVLKDFSFETLRPADRVAHAFLPIMTMLSWVAVLFLALCLSARSLRS